MCVLGGTYARDKRYIGGKVRKVTKCVCNMDTSNINHTDRINVHRVLSINSTRCIRGVIVKNRI